MENKSQLLLYFNASDKDQSGFIDAVELQQSLSNGTWKPFNIDTIKLMISLFDKKGNGTINFQEFSGLWSYIMEYQKVFSSYDTENKFTLTASQLHEALKNSGLDLPEDMIPLLISRINRSGTNVDFDDFIHISILLQKIRRSFRKLDTDKDNIVSLSYHQFVTSVFELITPL